MPLPHSLPHTQVPVHTGRQVTRHNYYVTVATKNLLHNITKPSVLTSHVSPMSIGVVLPWGVVNCVRSKFSTTLELRMSQVNSTVTVDMIINVTGIMSSH